METMLKAELADHLGYPHGDSKKKKTANTRNGSYLKSVKTTAGKLELDIPRDRKGTFNPKVVPKYEGVSSKKFILVWKFHQRLFPVLRMFENLSGMILPIFLSLTEIRIIIGTLIKLQMHKRPGSY
jgi:hypothetical protein